MFGNYIAGARNLHGRPADEKRIKGAAPPSKFTKAPTSGPQAAADVRCQRCLNNGHYTYDCKNAAVYKSRPSRSKQLLKPSKKVDGPSVQTPAEFGGSGQAVTSSLAITSGVAAKILDDKQKERKKKRGRSASSSSSDSSDSSDSDSDSSDSSDSSSSSSSSSSGSDSDASKGKGRKSRKRRESPARSGSQSPPRRRRRSLSAASREARRSASPVRRRRSSSRPARSPSPARGMSIKGKGRATEDA